MPRVNFYGLNFLYAGSAAILLNNASICRRNLGFILTSLFLFTAVKADFEAEKVWHLGKTAEEKLVERISGRLEEKAPYLPLTPVIAGELSLRPRYYAAEYNLPSPYVLNRSFIVRHIPSGMFNFYAPSPLFYSSSIIRSLSPELRSFLEFAVHPYPAEEALFIDDEYAVILLTSEGIAAIQAQLPR